MLQHIAAGHKVAQLVTEVISAEEYDENCKE